MADNKNHIFLTETESAAGSFDYRVNASDLLLDLKVLLKEYYIAILRRPPHFFTAIQSLSKCPKNTYLYPFCT